MVVDVDRGCKVIIDVDVLCFWVDRDVHWCVSCIFVRCGCFECVDLFFGLVVDLYVTSVVALGDVDAVV